MLSSILGKGRSVRLLFLFIFTMVEYNIQQLISTAETYLLEKELYERCNCKF